MRFFTVLYMTISILSCNQINQSEKITTIEMSNVIHKLKLSEFVEIDSLLKITPNGFIRFGGIKKTFILKDDILAHSIAPMTLSLLSYDGKIKSQYIPDYQMTEISSVALHNNMIYVSDRESMEVHIFDNNLEHQRKFSIPFFAQSITMLENDIIALYVGNEITENSGRLIFYDLANKRVISEQLHISENQRKYFNFLTNYNFLEIRHQSYFWNSPQNELFKINEDGKISPEYSLDYGDKGVPDDFYEDAKYDNPYEFVQDTRKKGYSHRHFKAFANEKFILINYDYGNQFATTLFSIDESKSTSFNDIFDDIWATQSMESIELSFFTDLNKEKSFTAFLPFEYLEKSDNANLSNGSDFLVFGKLKY